MMSSVWNSGEGAMDVRMRLGQVQAVELNSEYNVRNHVFACASCKDCSGLYDAWSID